MQEQRPTTIIINPTMTKKATARTPVEYAIFAFLILSFFAYGFYQSLVFGNGSFADLSMTADSIKSNFWFSVVFYGLLFWLIFELIMRLYMYIVSFSIYTFVIPKRNCFNAFRFWYAIKNTIMSGIYIGVLYFPLMLNYARTISLILNFAFLFVFFAYIKKKYLNSILAPFAFRAFFRPFLLFEAIMSIITIGGLLI